MKGDFTRDTFNAAKHFSRVLMQQGRVQLDADWNEQAAILLHYLQTLAADIIGPYGGPAGADNGFRIRGSGKSDMDFWIGPGRYYVDGILCENEEPSVYSEQSDYPLTEDQRSKDQKNLKQNAQYIAYLDVWERHVTYLDDHLIREVALGGPDTATRARVVCQVKVTDEAGYKMADEASRNKAARGRMRAYLKTEDVLPDPCITAPDSKYRGAENQLYRVEIHQVSTDEKGNLQDWSFKWSRENGSIAAAWLGTNEDGGLIVNTTHGFEAGSWVEITSTYDELHNTPGKMTKIEKVEAGALYLASGPDAQWDANTLVKIRQWDQRQVGDVRLKNGVVPGKLGALLDLENGIQVYFEPGDESHAAYWFRSGDTWLIPARVVTGEIEWPDEVDPSGKTVAAALPPRGIQHHYAPLWSMVWDGNAFTINEGDDLRSPMPYLTQLK